MTAPARLTSHRGNLMAVEADHIHEARTILAEQYELGHEAGRLLGRVEAVVVMAAAALAALGVWVLFR